MWSDSLLEYIDPEKYVIQIWTTGSDPSIKKLLSKGFR